MTDTNSRQAAEAAASRAAAAFSRSGHMVDPDDFAEVIREIGDKMAGTYLQYRDAFHADRLHELDYPIAALDHALAALAALAAALGYPPVLTACEITGRQIAEPTSPAGHTMRLHLLSHHGEPNTLPMTDAAAGRIHDMLHRGRLSAKPGSVGHRYEDLPVEDARCREVIDGIDPDRGQAQYALAYLEQRREHLAGTDG